MTRPSAAPRSAKAPAKAKGDTDAEPGWPPPLKPRRGLFIALLCVFALWVGVLLWMYFTATPRTAPEPATSKALAAGVVEIGQTMLRLRV